MIGSIIRFFYPDIKHEEVKKFTLLGLTLFFVIGTYWLLRLLKDVFIYELAFPTEFGWPMGYGREFIPQLKFISLFFVLGFSFLYAKLVDMFAKHKLFYIFCTFYATLFAVVTAMLYTVQNFGPAAIGKWPLAITGVAAYLATESFGSLIVALFWSFTISSTKTDEAKRGFPFIIAAAQFGAIGGSALVFYNIPTWILFALAIITLVSVMGSIWYLINSVPKEQMTSDKEEKKSKPDFLAGLKLLVTQPYLMGVLVVSTFYEISKTIVDYQMKSQASIIEGFMPFQKFLGIYGLCTNTLALVMALLGTSYVIKRFGLKFCLVSYPIMFAAATVGLYAYYKTNPSADHMLWATFGVMMLVTAFSYAVNNPTKEMMYIPTSKDAKFKTKNLIDMFGGRSAKMSGAQIGGFFNIPGQPASSLINLMGIGSLVSLGFIGVWLVVAIFVGTKNAQLVRDNQIIE